MFEFCCRKTPTPEPDEQQEARDLMSRMSNIDGKQDLYALRQACLSWSLILYTGRARVERCSLVFIGREEQFIKTREKR